MDTPTASGSMKLCPNPFIQSLSQSGPGRLASISGTSKNLELDNPVFPTSVESQIRSSPAPMRLDRHLKNVQDRASHAIGLLEKDCQLLVEIDA